EPLWRIGMENTASRNNEVLHLEQAAARAALLRECEKLAAAGITFVAVHFDGYGDDGATEEVKCYKSNCYGSNESESVDYDAAHLQDHFEALVPFGYENDCGGVWDVVLAGGGRKHAVGRNARCEGYTNKTYEASRL